MVRLYCTELIDAWLIEIMAIGTSGIGLVVGFDRCFW
jgi:hypothetical protein